MKSLDFNEPHIMDEATNNVINVMKNDLSPYESINPTVWIKPSYSLSCRRNKSSLSEINKPLLPLKNKLRLIFTINFRLVSFLFVQN